MSKYLLGLTGPSSFTEECTQTIEEYFDSDFVLLYHDDTQRLHDWVEKCDGVIFGGGADIHPSVYNQNVWSGQNLSRFALRRDEREMKIHEICEQLGKPYFGICRGHQLIGLLKGMSMVPDLTSSPICHNPNSQKISLDVGEPLHAVEIYDAMREEVKELFPMGEVEERATINRIMGWDKNEKMFVNSFHHQGVWYGGTPKDTQRSVPEGVKVYGYARVNLSKEVKNIVELMGGENWVSCQWHPESDWKINSASRAVLHRFKTLLEASKAPVKAAEEEG